MGDSRACPARCYAFVVLSRLPGWIVDDEASVRAEVAEWVDLTPAERWRLAVLCSRDAMWAIRTHPDPQRILEHSDPLPESTVQALARLRREAGWGHAGR
jgi:hypothetical protein